jgi:ubiquitin-conjugating enzyme E2 W
MNSMNRSRQLSNVAQRRLSRELAEWSVKEQPIPGMSVTTTDRLDEWLVSVQGAEDSVYAGEHYRLRFVFPAEYPMEAPEVVFLQPTPRHPHVYSNGHST